MEYIIESKKRESENQTVYLTWVRRDIHGSIVLLIESVTKPYVSNESLIIEDVEGKGVTLNISLFYRDNVIFDKE